MKGLCQGQARETLILLELLVAGGPRLPKNQQGPPNTKGHSAPRKRVRFPPHPSHSPPAKDPCPFPAAGKSVPALLHGQMNKPTSNVPGSALGCGDQRGRYKDTPNHNTESPALVEQHEPSPLVSSPVSDNRLSRMGVGSSS